MAGLAVQLTFRTRRCENIPWNDWLLDKLTGAGVCPPLRPKESERGDAEFAGDVGCQQADGTGKGGDAGARVFAGGHVGVRVRSVPPKRRQRRGGLGSERQKPLAGFSEAAIKFGQFLIGRAVERQPKLVVERLVLCQLDSGVGVEERLVVRSGDKQHLAGELPEAVDPGVHAVAGVDHYDLGLAAKCRKFRGETFDGAAIERRRRALGTAGNKAKAVVVRKRQGFDGTAMAGQNIGERRVVAREAGRKRSGGCWVARGRVLSLQQS